MIKFFDDNEISIDGSTKLTVNDNQLDRFAASNWDVQTVDGHNHKDISNAILNARESKKPSLIACKTKIGFGSPNKESSSSSHGSPLGEDEVFLTRNNLNWPHKSFSIPKNF